jgi:hypothetical protein
MNRNLDCLALCLHVEWSPTVLQLHLVPTFQSTSTNTERGPVLSPAPFVGSALLGDGVADAHDKWTGRAYKTIDSRVSVCLL